MKTLSINRYLFPLTVILLLLSSCADSANPEMVVEVPEKPPVILVGITPALSHLEDVFALYSCAADVEPIVEVLPWMRLREEEKDVILVYGDEGKDLPAFVYQIGQSELVFIVHPDLPVDSLGVAQLQAIYNGTMTDWSELSVASSYMGEIQLWGMMDETEIMQATLSAINLPNPTGHWQVVSTPADVVEMVSQDQNSIGVVPAYVVTDGVAVLSISDVELPVVPILAVWNHKPNEAEQEWLLCVQGAME